MCRYHSTSMVGRMPILAYSDLKSYYTQSVQWIIINLLPNPHSWNFELNHSPSRTLQNWNMRQWILWLILLVIWLSSSLSPSVFEQTQFKNNIFLLIALTFPESMLYRFFRTGITKDYSFYQIKYFEVLFTLVLI